VSYSRRHLVAVSLTALLHSLPVSAQETEAAEKETQTPDASTDDVTEETTAAATPATITPPETAPVAPPESSEEEAAAAPSEQAGSPREPEDHETPENSPAPAEVGGGITSAPMLPNEAPEQEAQSEESNETENSDDYVLVSDEPELDGEVSPDETRHGFFMRFSLLTGPLFLFAEGDLTNGLRGETATTGRAFGGGVDAVFGGSLGRHFALGGYLSLGAFSAVRVQRRGLEVSMRSLHLNQLSLGGNLAYFPKPGSGYHLGAQVGITSLYGEDEPFFSESGGGAGFIDASGLNLTLIAGKEWKLFSHMWGGLAGRIKISRLDSQYDEYELLTVAPTLSATATWF